MDSFIFFLEVLKSERTGLNRKPNDYLLYREKKYLYIFLEHLWHSRTVEKSHAMNGLPFPDKRFGSNGKSASKVWREISCQKIRDWNRSSLIINIYLWNRLFYWKFLSQSAWPFYFKWSRESLSVLLCSSSVLLVFNCIKMSMDYDS